MQTKIILWERGNKKRGQSFINFRKEITSLTPLNWDLIWDSDTSNISKARHWDTLTDMKKSVLIVHLNNLLSPEDVLRSIIVFNRKYPDIPVIIYSGGIETVTYQENGKKIILSTDMGDLSFIPDHPKSIYVFPRKVGDDVVTSLNLKEAVKIFSKNYSISDLFDTIQRPNFKLESFFELADNLSFPVSLKDKHAMESTEKQLNSLRNIKEFFEPDINYLARILNKIKKDPVVAEKESTYLEIKEGLNKLSTQLSF